MKLIILLMLLININMAASANSFINGKTSYYAQDYIYNLDVGDLSKNALKQYSTAITELLGARLTQEKEIDRIIFQINRAEGCVNEYSDITNAHKMELNSILFANPEDRDKARLFEHTFYVKIQLSRNELISNQQDYCN